MEKSQKIKFDNAIAKDDDTWTYWAAKIKWGSLMRYCISQKNQKWVKKISADARGHLTGKGLVKNPVLGWVDPKELDLAGVEFKDGSWKVTDIKKMNLYQEAKKEQSMKEGKEKFVSKLREMHKKENEEYLEQLVNGQEPF